MDLKTLDGTASGDATRVNRGCWTGATAAQGPQSTRLDSKGTCLCGTAHPSYGWKGAAPQGFALVGGAQCWSHAVLDLLDTIRNTLL
jgi:hypothetical protein